MYLARDKNNDLYLFNDLPIRGSECWWAEKGVDGTYLRLNPALYPEVTWDKEPLPVRLVAGEGE
ncbi:MULTISPECIES: hypothetical protein [Geobacter]|uniref:Uncharacterized protein n=2 Tax=Geobacter TaxID=28231 RepID=A0A0C1TSY9_9BACT|nr:MULTISPECIES: hypothetical protein [Geobacter]ANA40428.1 hypothetical protein A2G06_09130 [Geobacter anodireducens]KIE42443.1 hypothetical protein SE37_07275 [Geobacter soli]MBE2887161.1 hypothetical protein [Geobacter anodireducens]HMN03766.1 hypothetical protein [Geobacter anodireducens]